MKEVYPAVFLDEAAEIDAGASGAFSVFDGRAAGFLPIGRFCANLIGYIEIQWRGGAVFFQAYQRYETQRNRYT
jgi:hypothetical protein